MAEVYAVPGAPAPPPSGAYPVWHEYVGTVPVARLDMQPDGRASALRSRFGRRAPAQPGWRRQARPAASGPEVRPPVSPPAAGHGRSAESLGDLHSAEFGLRRPRLQSQAAAAGNRPLFWSSASAQGITAFTKSCTSGCLGNFCAHFHPLVTEKFRLLSGDPPTLPRTLRS